MVIRRPSRWPASWRRCKRANLGPSLLQPLQPVNWSTQPSIIAASSHDEDSLIQQAALHRQQLSLLRDATRAFQRSLARLAPFVTTLCSFGHEQSSSGVQCGDQRRFVSESEGAFLDEALSLCYQLPPEYSGERLQKLYLQLREDHQRQSDHSLRTRATESELANSEYHLQRSEELMAQATDKLASALAEIDLPGPEEPNTSSATTEIELRPWPNFVEYYFTKVGEFNVERERLIFLQVEHSEERIKRILQADQDMHLPITDEEFEKSFERTYEEQQAAVMDAEEKVVAAKRSCLLEDHDSDSYRNRASTQGDEETTAEGSPTSTQYRPPSPPMLDTDIESSPTTNKFTFDPFKRAVPIPSKDPVPHYGPFLRPQSYRLPPVSDRVAAWKDGLVHDAESHTHRKTRSLPESEQLVQEAKARPLLDYGENAII